MLHYLVFSTCSRLLICCKRNHMIYRSERTRSMSFRCQDWQIKKSIIMISLIQCLVQHHRTGQYQLNFPRFNRRKMCQGGSNLLENPVVDSPAKVRTSWSLAGHRKLHQKVKIVETYWHDHSPGLLQALVYRHVCIRHKYHQEYIKTKNMPLRI
jgi:hypothetical protein